jgi:hypothetical protein
MSSKNSLVDLSKDQDLKNEDAKIKKFYTQTFEDNMVKYGLGSIKSKSKPQNSNIQKSPKSDLLGKNTGEDQYNFTSTERYTAQPVIEPIQEEQEEGDSREDDFSEVASDDWEEVDP